MPLWQVVLLGVVQGITEFLPISSTAHLLLLQELFGRSREELARDPFTVVIQLGTVGSVFAYFRRDIRALALAFLQDLRQRAIIRSTSPEGRMAKLIMLGTIPVVIVGLLFKDWLKETFYNAPAIAWVAIGFAGLMLLAEVWAARRRRQHPPRDEGSITWVDTLFVGVFQAMALMPGASRSGTTITAGLFAGLSRSAAARFSFLLSLPSILAAGVKELYDWLKEVRASAELQANLNAQVMELAVGTLVSFVVGYAAIAWLMNYLRRYSMMVFVVYRVILGVLILVLITRGVVAR